MSRASFNTVGLLTLNSVSGSVNYIPKFNSLNSITNSSIFETDTLINMSSGIFNIDRTNSRVGINVTPTTTLDIFKSTTGSILKLKNGVTSGWADLIFGLNSNSGTGNGESYLDLVTFNGVANEFIIGNSVSIPLTFRISSTTILQLTTAGNVVLTSTNAGAIFQAAGSQQGIKLPATPGNSDTQVLDCYIENTRSVTSGTTGWTYVTCTQFWTVIGKNVTLHTVFTGGTSSATAPATVPTPPGLTPLRIAAGTAVNTNGTALGNGICVAVPTSSTTGTITTSNSITSSAVDKVLTVTYETAGL